MKKKPAKVPYIEALEGLFTVLDETATSTTHPILKKLDDKEHFETRLALQRTAFFKPNERDPAASYEGDLVKAIAALLGSDGAHTGSSGPSAATYRYALAVLTSDYFLNRLATGDT